jgi:hypothetical protein
VFHVSNSSVAKSIADVANTSPESKPSSSLTVSRVFAFGVQSLGQPQIPTAYELFHTVNP